MVAQNVPIKKKNYYTWVDVVEGKKLKRGFLVGVEGNEINYLHNKDLKKWREYYLYQSLEFPSDIKAKKTSDHLKVRIPIKNVHSLKFKKKPKYLSSTGWGALIGGSAGSVILMSTYNGQDFLFSKGSYGAIGFMLGGVLGALIGKVLDSPKIEFYIGGKQDLFLKNKERIISFIYKIP
jgi:hypothetical protein